MEVPASVRGDGAAFRTALRHRRLRAYLACGVTTVLDTGIRIAVARELRAWLARGHPGTRFLTLAPPIAPRHGCMCLMEPSLAVGGVGDLDRVFDAIANVGAVGVKVPIDRWHPGRLADHSCAQPCRDPKGERQEPGGSDELRLVDLSERPSRTYRGSSFAGSRICRRRRARPSCRTCSRRTSADSSESSPMS